MRIFATGATGFSGSAIVQDLIDAGHQVFGLARSGAGAALLSGHGMEVYRGDMTDPVRNLAPDDAPAHFGFLGMFVRADVPASSAFTREQLSWRPRGPDLLTDLRENGSLA